MTFFNQICFNQIAQNDSKLQKAALQNTSYCYCMYCDDLPIKNLTDVILRVRKFTDTDRLEA